MKETKVYIKNMVCDRCISAVSRLFTEMDMEPVNVKLGEVALSREMTTGELASLGSSLGELGFELIGGRRERLIEQVRALIIELVHDAGGGLRENLSGYIGGRLHHDYNYISGLFSEMEGTTIEKYFIAQKVERVKELLAYDELSLAQIADSLNYSSAAHMGSQFKKATGLSPGRFRRMGGNGRRPIDKV